MKILIYILHCWCTLILFLSGYLSEKFYFSTFLSIASHESNSDIKLLGTILKISIQNCISECQYVRNCRFINYFVRTRTCELIASNSINVSVKKQPGIIFGDRNDWDTSSLAMCSSCYDNERCRPEVPACDVDICGSPDVSNGTILTGNVYRVGAILKYDCIIGYTKKGSSYTTCQSNGLWDSLDTCIKGHRQCPLETNYKNTTLSDGTTFKYWLVRSEFTKEMGAALCLACHGRLVQIIDSPKLTFLRNILMEKANGFDYWIDGSNADVANFSSNDAWTTASGYVIPKTDDLWAPNKPDYEDREHCIRLKYAVGYYFDNFYCSESFRVICEFVN